MNVKSIPGAGRFATGTKIIVAVAVGGLGLAAYLTGSEALWDLFMQLAPAAFGAP